MMYDLRDLPRAPHHTNIGMPLMDSHNPIHQICSVTGELVTASILLMTARIEICIQCVHKGSGNSLLRQHLGLI